ncbi:MAG TPA: hypothetical protein VKT77_22170 [Chthonomonadaceae bacterium]|nr:hypothetical protein [Chthonomonadaceae bacterium]
MSMPVQPGEGRSPASGMLRAGGRQIGRAEAAILAGMLICMASLFAMWPISLRGQSPLPAMVVNLTREGWGLPEVRWPITACAILPGLALVMPAPRVSRIAPAFVQALCGIVCFVIALTHFGMLAGPIAALVGGLLIAAGAVDCAGQQERI